MPQLPKIAIVGAGLVGRLLAYQLSKLDYAITLFEKDTLTLPSTTDFSQLSAAAFSAAGMIAPISETLESDMDTYLLGNASLVKWPLILQQLKEAGSNVFYQQNGSLIVSHPQDNAELTHFKRRVEQLAQQSDAQYQTLDSNQIMALEPDLGNGFHTGLLLHNEANIDNRQLMNALLRQCIESNVEIIDRTKVSISNNCVISTTKTHQYDWVFDCRGFGAKEQLPALRGVRGEVLRVHCPQVTLTRPVRLMHPRYQLYLVPKPDQQYVIGATQIESEDTSAMSVQSMLELCSAMYSISPAFSEARIIEQNTNLRPALKDNRAQICVADQHISINGLFRHGYLVAPAIVDCVINWLQGTHDEFFDTLFHIDRNTHNSPLTTAHNLSSKEQPHA